jgi:hypothetical protein
LSRYARQYVASTGRNIWREAIPGTFCPSDISPVLTNDYRLYLPDYRHSPYCPSANKKGNNLTFTQIAKRADQCSHISGVSKVIQVDKKSDRIKNFLESSGRASNPYNGIR